MAVCEASADGPVGTEGRPVITDKRWSTGWKLTLSGALLFVALLFIGRTGLLWYCTGRPDVTTQSGRTEAPTNSDTAERTDSSDALRIVSSEEKAAVHLEVEGFCKDGELKWRDSGGDAFAQGGLRLVNNTIVIPQSGLYFVYSQAVFSFTCSYDTYVSHKIFRYSDSFAVPRLIMFAIKSVCQDFARQNGKDNFFEPVYLGAVFHLKEGDRLEAKLYWDGDVQTDSGKTFFGVFAV
ncbi:tumor necrosis factor-like [Pagrus major]|uniref:tumor necrosis factor-like n=1 Tax=Pagrus major TaxID=143350 RepID=UPI003CC8C91E